MKTNTGTILNPELLGWPTAVKFATNKQNSESVQGAGFRFRKFISSTVNVTSSNPATPDIAEEIIWKIPSGMELMITGVNLFFDLLSAPGVGAPPGVDTGPNGNAYVMLGTGGTVADPTRAVFDYFTANSWAHSDGRWSVVGGTHLELANKDGGQMNGVKVFDLGEVPGLEGSSNRGYVMRGYPDVDGTTCDEVILRMEPYLDSPGPAQLLTYQATIQIVGFIL